MYWNSVLFRFYALLNVFSLFLLLLCFPISVVGIGERLLNPSEQNKIPLKAVLVNLLGVIIWLLIFLFVPTTFRI
jgi:hypothetical protein